MNSFRKAIKTVQLEQNNEGVVKIEFSLVFWEKSKKGLYLSATPYKENGTYLPQMGSHLFLEGMARFSSTKCDKFIVSEEEMNYLLNAVLYDNGWTQKN